MYSDYIPEEDKTEIKEIFDCPELSILVARINTVVENIVKDNLDIVRDGKRLLNELSVLEGCEFSLVMRCLNKDVLNTVFMEIQRRFIRAQLRDNPKANKEVIQFISDVRFHNSVSVESETTIRTLFRQGYCFYFAKMLQIAFKRGKLRIPYNYANEEMIDHVVWEDEDGIMYDIEGVFNIESALASFENKEDIEYWGEEDLSHYDIEDFKHTDDLDRFDDVSDLKAVDFGGYIGE